MTHLFVDVHIPSVQTYLSFFSITPWCSHLASGSESPLGSPSAQTSGGLTSLQRGAISQVRKSRSLSFFSHRQSPWPMISRPAVTRDANHLHDLCCEVTLSSNFFLRPTSSTTDSRLHLHWLNHLLVTSQSVESIPFLYPAITSAHSNQRRSCYIGSCRH